MKCTSAPHSTRWGVSGWRIHFLEVFFTHVCAALVFLGSSHPQGIASPRASPHELDVSQLGNFMVDTLLWQLSPKRQEVEVSRPAKGYAQMNIQSLPLYSICQNSHRAHSNSKGQTDTPHLDGIGQSHIAKECVE